MRRTHRLVRAFQILTLIIALAHGYASCAAQDRKPPTFETVMNSGNAGTEFFIAIPPNEILPFPVEGLEVYVASEQDAAVEVYDYASDKTFRFTNKANQIRTISDRNVLNWSMEVREAESPQRKGLRIKSDKPITVSVINSKVTTTDAYLAIPTSSWGTEYISVGYSDFREVKPWPGGFMIIAKEPTQVDILLRGSGKNAATTSGGRKIGDRISVFLDEGEVYMVHGDGQTRSSFDLSGSLITSNKPVGVIGFHMRTTIPNMLINGNGRNHLCEMLPPTSVWGKKYSTIELKRTRQSAGRGDVFKVVAKDDQTKWTCKYYDKSSGKLLGQRGGLLQKAGDFQDETQTTQPTALVEGFSVWEADKPIFVMQYSCSSSWDGDQLLDPFMFSVCPEEQFITRANFQTPTMAQFTRHHLNLIVKTDTTDEAAMETNLKSLTIDGVPVWSDPRAEQPSLLLTRMPNGLFWASIDLGTSAQARRITGNGKVSFAGYLYGYGAIDAYGMPLSTIAVNVVRTIDTMPPTIEVTAIPGQCGAFRGQAKEFRNIPDPPNATPQPGDQIESGIASIDSVAGSRSFNYQLKLVTDSSFPAVKPYKSFRYEWIVIDAAKPARVIYEVRDFSGNVTLDTLAYTPASTIDTAKPTIELVSAKPLIWDIGVNEQTFSPDPPRICPQNNDQLDRGLSEITIERVNMRLIADKLTFPAQPAVRRTEFTLVVEDINAKASAIIVAKDHAGNIARDTIVYDPTTDVYLEQTAPTAINTTLSPDGQSVTATLPEGIAGLTLGLYDLQGRQLKSIPLNDASTVKVTLSELQIGVYVICASGADRLCSAPIIYAP
jgi:hypothetical protein